MDEKNSKEKLLSLRKTLKGELKKLYRKLKKQESEYKIAGKWLWYQQIGDSLLARKQEIPKGASEYDLFNVHTQKKEQVKLNPKYDAVRNAKIYYRKAKKGKRGNDICAEQLDNTKNEIVQIEAFIERCNDCLSLDEETEEFEAVLNGLIADFEEYHPKGALKEGKEGKKPAKIPYRHYTIDGWNVYIGKNNAQNDELSTKFAKPRDIWLHIAAHSGSHCVIKRDKDQEWPPKQVIEKVAALSVWFSRAKHTSYAEVHVTEARYVRKPRKSPPGEVVIQQYKTVRVSPKSPQELFKE
jgi:predicted ribosome quality control (RQC) complex YloA/Tae2 family protein